MLFQEGVLSVEGLGVGEVGAEEVLGEGNQLEVLLLTKGLVGL